MVREIQRGKAMVLSVACLVLSVADSDGASYFPLREGNYWVYPFRAPSRVTERKDDIVNLELDGLLITLRDRGTDIDIELPTGGFALFYRFVPGSSWVYNDPVGFCNHNSPVTVTLETEPVVTPAGAFHDCLRLEFDYNDCLHGGFQAQWWAPEVGLVKWQEEFVGVVELVDYCVDGGDCADSFGRGDSNADNAFDIADAIFTLSYLFAEDSPPTCLDAADANDDGAIDIADAIAILGHLFGGAAPLPEPFGECGIDPTADDLTCASYPPCE